MQRRIQFIIVTLSTLAATGCVSSLTGDTYSRSEARAAQRVETGIIEQLRPVRIEGTKTVIGPVVGGAVGGIAAEGVGDGRGRRISRVLGATAGGVVGAAVEEGITRRDAVEITVAFADGHRVAVVQEINPRTSFRVGDEVRVLYLEGTTRVTY